MVRHLLRHVVVSLLAVPLVVSVVCAQSVHVSPAPSNGQVANLNGAQIFYTVLGDGPPLLLIHGYPLNGDLFTRQQQDLGRRFQVITVDRRGFGRSVAPSPDASISTYAQDMLALMDYLGISQVVVGGHSMGGITALEMIKTAPDRIRGLVLIDTTSAAAPAFEQALLGGEEPAQLVATRRSPKAIARAPAWILTKFPSLW